LHDGQTAGTPGDQAYIEHQAVLQFFDYGHAHSPFKVQTLENVVVRFLEKMDSNAIINECKFILKLSVSNFRSGSFNNMFKVYCHSGLNEDHCNFVKGRVSITLRMGGYDKMCVPAP